MNIDKNIVALYILPILVITITLIISVALVSVMELNKKKGDIK